MPDVTCLNIVRNPVTYDSRVLKEIRSIDQTGFFDQVEVAGFHEPGYTDEEVLDGRTVRRFRLRTRSMPKDLLSQAVKYAEWYLRLVRHYRSRPLKLIHCHDLAPLPVAVRLKKLTGARLIYDAHELETEMTARSSTRKKLAWQLEKRLIPHVDGMVTVSPSILEWYRQRFPKTPIRLVRNVPEYMHRPEAVVPLREELGIPADALLFLYLGGLGKGRGIEKALAAFEQERVPHHVLFMGDGPLKGQVQAAGRRCTRIHHRAPVPPSEVVAHAAGADVGLCLYEDTCLNHRYCLPNKLFESLLSGLPVLASDLPDQAQVVRDHDAGWVVGGDTGEVATFLRGLSVSEARAKQDGLPGRVTDLRWENEAEELIDLYREALGDRAISIRTRSSS